MLLPVTWSLVLKPIIFGEIQRGSDIKSCECKQCTARLEKRIAHYKYSWMNKWMVVKLVILSLFWTWDISSFLKVKDLTPLRGFVPFEILGVETSATVA
jgi:preprotein translocase subunit Sec63